MLDGACVCGLVSWTLFAKIDGATACNCTACRRYGVLWAYGHLDADIKTSGPTKSYSRGAEIEFHFCECCGSMAYWLAKSDNSEGKYRIAVNLRLAEPEFVANIPIDHFDGLETFSDLPRDGKCVADYWA